MINQGINRQIFELGNQFHVTRRTVCPKICNQCLREKRWKTKTRAEKAKKLKTKM